MVEKIKSILENFQIEGQVKEVFPIEIGHINETYKVTLTNEHHYILQNINTSIFRNPMEVMENIAKVGEYLQQKGYPKIVLLPVKTIDKHPFIKLELGCWRLYPFIENTITYNTVDTPEKAYQAAFTFGEYAAYLSEFEANKLHYTIPNFHNTPLRFEQFKEAIKQVSSERLNLAKKTITKLQSFSFLLNKLQGIKLPLRVVHNDTKINNILFDKSTLKPVCIVDLDTLMPGSLIYDYGDMVRTCTPSLDENSADFDRVFVRKPVLTALTTGYLDGIGDRLTETEKNALPIGAQLIIFEQALRFLTDFLQGDIYYKVKNKKQNLIRAKNQLCLLTSVING